MASLVGKVGLMVRRLNPRIPEEQGDSKVASAWFVDPGRSAVEFVLCCLWVVQFLFADTRQGPALQRDWIYDPAAQRGHDTLDTLSGLFVGVHMFTITYYKYTTNRTWFLLQPCNFWVFALTYMHFSRSALAVFMFNIYLHLQWGSWLGLLVADLRDYKHVVEIINFFTLHIAIVLAPVYHIVRGTFAIYPSDVFGCGTVFIMYHWLCCLPLAILTGWNIDYMMCPPTQLRKLGGNYRIVMAVVGYLLAAAMRLGLAGSILALVGRGGR